MLLCCSADAKTMECSDLESSTVTHTSKNDKSTITVTWTHPEFGGTSNKDISFHFTVVQTFSTFWALEKLDTTLNVLAKEGAPESEPETKAGGLEGEAEGEAEGAPENLPEDYQGCFVTKGCFGLGPSDCEKNGNCQLLASYTPTANKFQILLRGAAISSNNYLAVGISNDAKMGDDLVLACDVTAKNMIPAWNVGGGARNNIIGLQGVDFTNVNITSADGVSYCYFEVDSVMSVTPPNDDPKRDFDLSDQRYHLLLALGPMQSGNLGQHTQRIASGSPVDFKSFEAIQAQSNILLRVHGALMVLAWMGAASAGMFFARYMKETWKEKKLMGKDIWFPFHQASMGFAFIVSVISFIIIISERGNLFHMDTLKKNPHPVMGLITVLLAFINPMMAAFRPHPGTPLRPIFNWSHWFVGNAAWLFGIVSIFLAGDLDNTDFIPTNKYFYMILVFVLVHAFWHIMFSLQRCLAFNNSEVHSDNPSEEGSVGDLKNSTRDLREATFRKVAAILYVVFVWVYGFVVAFHIGLGKVGARQSGYWFEAYGEAEAEGEAEPEGHAEAEGEAEAESG